MNSQVKSCFHCNRPGHLANDCTVTKGKKCNNCQKVGYFAKICRTKPQRSSKTNVVAHEEFEDHSTNIEEVMNFYVCDENFSSDEYICYVGNNRQDEFELRFNGCPVDVKMLIDSRATVNLLNSVAFNNLLNKPCLKKSNTKIFPTFVCNSFKSSGII